MAITLLLMNCRRCSREIIMAKITFRAKVQQVGDCNGSIAYEYLQVPILERKHCDMNAFRSHPKYGSYANSDLFKGMLKRIRSERFKDGMIRMDSIPDGVTVEPGFLYTVTFDV